MTHTITAKAVRGGLLAAALLAAAATPAQATHQESFQANWLYVSVTHGDNRSGDTRGTLLTCDPPQGHSRAAEACEQLTAVAGRVDRMPARGEVCPMVYAPVTAHARGRWNGMSVDYTRTFGNACELADLTGPVFAMGD
ncbi:SSI family serine proteinase inhibitor [Streptomyces sp. NPDC005017]|uniref:SSI family serine proteinase inhibitor n=1 Tax=Streptomyces sp. NPDC005017 TaxID=3364706 RepID=UPI0036BAA155